MRYKNKGYSADTLYFGGGTPNLISPYSIGAIIDAVKDVFKLSGEISIEANPRLITLEKIKILQQCGVNRVSVGMQSAVETELTALGRFHTAIDVFNAVGIVKSAGINNISLDMMLGVPYQTMSSVDTTISFIGELDVKHVSAYILTVEENTPFYQSEIITHCPSEDEVAKIYLHTIKKLGSIGFNQYEISNFSKVGYESIHNLKYWQSKSYLGFGASAHSFLNGKRYAYPNSTTEYINKPKWICTDSSCDEYTEYVMLGLRLTQGINTEYIKSHFGISKDKLLNTAKPLQALGLINIVGDNIFLTPQGFLVSNSIIVQFI